MRTPASLVVLATIAASLLLALVITVEMNGTVVFDAVVREQVHRLASPPLTVVAETVTWLGALSVLAPLAAVAVALLLRAGRRDGVVLLAVTMAGAVVLENALKFSFHRLRPPPFFGAEPGTYSFPSGHALFSLSFYGVLAIIAARASRWASTKAVIWIATALLVAAIGWSRVYLGVHYPSDVLGGYLVATAWIAIVLSAERRMRT